MLPRTDVLATISLWSAMCFAFSGFEIGGLVSEEVKDAERTVPRAILISGVVVTVIYVVGSASVLIAVPAGTLQELSGIADAVEHAGVQLGLAGMGALTGGLLALGSLAGNNSWFGGAARVPFAAGVHDVLPPAFARLHPRHHTPVNALVVQGLVATAIFLLSLFVSITGGSTTIQEAYDILVNLTILVYFVPYLYLFPTLIRLRRLAGGDDHGVARVPGGTPGLWLVAAAGIAATATSMALVFVPPPDTVNVLNYEVNLIGQSAIVIGLGVALYWWSARR